jgi:hypothetical protein
MRREYLGAAGGGEKSNELVLLLSHGAMGFVVGAGPNCAVGEPVELSSIHVEESLVASMSSLTGSSATAEGSRICGSSPPASSLMNDPRNRVDATLGA